MRIIEERLADLQRAAVELNPGNLNALRFDILHLIEQARQLHDFVRSSARKQSKPGRPYLERTPNPAHFGQGNLHQPERKNP